MAFFDLFTHNFKLFLPEIFILLTSIFLLFLGAFIIICSLMSFITKVHKLNTNTITIFESPSKVCSTRVYYEQDISFQISHCLLYLLQYEPPP
jgi:hypothetical protein